MINQELIDYVKKHREGGFSDEAISRELENAGWGQDDIEHVLRGQTMRDPKKLKGVSVLLFESWHLFRQRILTFVGLSFLILKNQ